MKSVGDIVINKKEVSGCVNSITKCNGIQELTLDRPVRGKTCSKMAATYIPNMIREEKESLSIVCCSRMDGCMQ